MTSQPMDAWVPIGHTETCAVPSCPPFSEELSPQIPQGKKTVFCVVFLDQKAEGQGGID